MNLSPRILVAEDDALMRQMLRATLEQAGYVVEVAVNGREAVAHQQRAAFHILLTDLVMPEQEGLETIMEFRRNHPAVKIIAMSGGGRGNAEDYLSVAAKLGARQVLAKPFSTEVLLRAIADQLSTS